MEEAGGRFKNKFRHELKYLVDERDIALIEGRLKAVMKSDRHNEAGPYQIRSVYFDDYRNTAFYENIDGISPRSKYRIRIYNGGRDAIFLEKKTKNYDMTYKESCLLSKEQCASLLKGKYTLRDSGQPKLLQGFTVLSALNGYQPKIMVIYERRAFVCREGNVRVTLDCNLESSVSVDRLFEANIKKRPVMPAGKHLLEVKYDEFLPCYIKEALNSGKLQRTSFSKYVLCRNYAGG